VRVGWLIVLGLVTVAVGVLAAAFNTTHGCYPESWWVDWTPNGVRALFPPYIIPVTLALTGATFVAARTVRLSVARALTLALVMLVVGGFGVWFLALIDGLNACPP
jgi:hypothetical protein